MGGGNATVSIALSSYNTDRHTYLYNVGFEAANSGLCAEQFMDNAFVSGMCTSTVSTLGHKESFRLRNVFRFIRVDNL